MKSIYNFKKGDEITRLEPSKPIQSLLGETRDRSYMGDKLIFIGIANNQIYFRLTDEFSLKLFGDKIKGVPLDLWSEGWDYYFDPLKLEQGELQILDKSQIEDQISKAIEQEDYELAEKLKKSIDNDQN